MLKARKGDASVIHVVVLNGASSSIREVKTHHIIREILQDHGIKYTLYWEKASRRNAGKILDYIEDNESFSNTLICVGKSLGGKYMVKKVLNKIGAPFYHKIFLLTIDINWPILFWDWTPNLNKKTVNLKCPVRYAANIYVEGKPKQQCGALLAGKNVRNIPVTGVNHYSVIHHKKVRSTMKDILCYT